MSQQTSSFSFEDLIACSRGALFGPGNARLPAPPLLMMDRITHIRSEGGAFSKGVAIAELDIRPDLWFFQCHFEDDPVMPGCFGLDALLQLLGFYLGWSGAKGVGRARSVGVIQFKDMILPTARLITYELHVKRAYLKSNRALGIANGLVKVDGEPACAAEDLRVGLFPREGTA